MSEGKLSDVARGGAESTSSGMARIEREKTILTRKDAVHGSLWKPPQLIRGENVDENQDLEREGSWSELFFDLIFVTAISRLGELYREGSLPGREYILLFTIVWVYWWQSSEFMNRFHSDDLSSKLYLLLFQGSLVGIALNVEGAIDGDNSHAFVCFAAMINLIHLLTYLRIYIYFRGLGAEDTSGGQERKVVGFARQHVYMNLVFLAVWAAAYTVPTDYRYAVMWLFPASHFFTFVHAFLFVYSLNRGYTFCLPLARVWMPVHIDHWVERTGGLMIIFMGECVDGIAKAIDVKSWEAYLSVGCCFVIIFCIKLLFFDTNIIETDNHAFRVKWWKGIIYQNLFCVQGLCVVLLGDSLAELTTIVAEASGPEGSFDDPELREREHIWFSRACWCMGGSFMLIQWTNFTHEIMYKQRYKARFLYIERLEFALECLAALIIFCVGFTRPGGHILWKMSGLAAASVGLVAIGYIDEIIANTIGEDVTAGPEMLIDDIDNLDDAIDLANSLERSSESFTELSESVRYLVLVDKTADGKSRPMKIAPMELGIDGAFRWECVGAYVRETSGLKRVQLREYMEPEASNARYELVIKALSDNGMSAGPALKRDLIRVCSMDQGCLERSLGIAGPGKSGREDDEKAAPSLGEGLRVPLLTEEASGGRDFRDPSQFKGGGRYGSINVE